MISGQTSYAEEPIIVLANREPVRHEFHHDGRIVATRSAGGLVTALEPLMRACRGVWVAHGSGPADRFVVDERDGIGVPPANPSYRLRRVWLDAAEVRGYYNGFANEGIWPLCHRAGVRPVFRPADFEAYRAVNRRFARIVCDEAATASPVVLVQDYHFALAPRTIRARMPDATIIAFWHIPWPRPGDFAACPWARQLVEGLLGSTIVGFQTQDDCRNFIETVEQLLAAEIDRKRSAIVHDGRRATVRAYAASIEWPSRWTLESPPIDECRRDVRSTLGLGSDALLGVGVDRLDYTKGLNEKFVAVERFLETHPEYRGRFAFAQIAEPSRECLSVYRRLRAQLWDTATRINRRFGSDGVQPILLLDTHYDPPDVYRFFRAADFCYVGSLHDGMNLVAKEFVSARDDERGVLVLSRFAGAARELSSALIVNPYETADVAQAFADALSMRDRDRTARMRAMRSVVAEFNTYRWAAEMLADAGRSRPEPAAPPRESPYLPAAFG